MNQRFEELKSKEYQRKEQQGLGREIISVEHKGIRFVAVGDKLLYPKPGRSWKTFHDFLNDYIKTVLGEEWGEIELRKSFMHPVLQWYQLYCELKKKNKTKKGAVFSTLHTGASIAFLGLAYNLYLLQHNKGVQTELIRRIKLPETDSFYGIIYETYVAAHFVKAGFNIEFEDELDIKRTHCEFTAINKETGKQFSVEAKTVKPNRKNVTKIVSKLNEALKKQADHERIVFIDIGKPASNFEESYRWLIKAQGEIRKHEESSVRDISLPRAYVVITNNSYWHDLKGRNFNFSAIAEGFQIPNFKHDYKGTIRDGLKLREEHKEVFALMDSINKHGDIPSTFDGENPALAFDETEEKDSRLIIGCKYLVPRNDGSSVPATLEHVIVDEKRKIAVGAYKIEGGGSTICSCPLSDAELEGYRRHPNTFFGKLTGESKLEDPLELYDWAYSAYKNAPKERLLEFMENWPNQAELKKLSQEELLQLYCEGITETASK